MVPLAARRGPCISSETPKRQPRADMTTRRAVTYGGLTCLLAAWLASAASPTFQPPSSEPERVMTGPSPEALAIEVQTHATRLRERLQSAPTPQQPHRNPFVFAMRPQPVARPATVRRAETVATVGPSSPPEPTLSLIGIAEDQAASGMKRTAIIADESESVLMVTVGETLLGRYRVEAIGADAIELKDVGTNAMRRLGLR